MKVQIPILNKATGRSGDTIFQSYNGNTYTRSMPVIFHYPDTHKQQVTQATFFDLQRTWIPIYEVLKNSIQRQQRKNKNPFNVMSSFIYKILQPFKPNADYNLIKSFGLDPLNRVRTFVYDVHYSINPSDVVMQFSLKLERNDTSFEMTETNIILFNRTKMSMYFQSIRFEESPLSLKFVNTNEWESGDSLLMYVSLSCDSWLGNFNICELWLK